MRFFRNLKLRTKLLLAFLSIGLLPLLALVYTNLYITQNTLLQESRTNLFNVVAAGAGHVDYWINIQHNEIQSEANLQDIQSLVTTSQSDAEYKQLQDGVHKLLETLQAKNDTFIVSYAVMDATGEVLVDTEEAQIGRNKADRNYFQRFLGDADAAQSVSISHAHGNHDDHSEDAHAEDEDHHDTHAEDGHSDHEDDAHTEDGAQGIQLGGIENITERHVSEYPSSYFSGLIYPENTKNPAVYFSAPIADANGQIQGILRVKYSADVLQSLVLDLDNLAGPDSFNVLFTKEHMYLAHGNNDGLAFNLAHTLNEDVRQEMQTHKLLPMDMSNIIALDVQDGIPHDLLLDVTIEHEHTHVDHREEAVFLRAKDPTTGDSFNQVALLNLHEAPWTMAVYLSEEAFTGPVRTQNRNILFVAGLVGVALVISGLSFANFITKPIENLTAVAQRVENGDLKASIERNSKDEIGTLGNAFNSMTSKLRYYIEQLEEEKQKDRETARQQQEGMLSLLEATFDSTADGILVTDLSGKTIQANRKLSQIWQLPADLVNSPLDLNLTHLATQLEDHQVLKTLLKKLQAEPQSSVVETLNLRNDRVIEMFAQPQLRGEETMGRVWSFRDVTERHQHAQQLLDQQKLLAQQVAEQTAEIRAANAELARSAKAKDEFLASMSHELRTPLSAILGNTEMLSEKILGDVNDRQKDALRMIDNSGTHLLSLINDILDIAKVGAGNLKLDIRPTFVREVVHASLEMVRTIAERKHQQVYVDIDDSIHTIDIDAKRFKQILVNLLNNAVKFTPEKGKIGIKVVASPEDDTARFMVWDTGIGIAKDNIDKLFKPFIQLDSALSRRYEGTGLGLSLVYHMVDLHGGNIKVQSKLDEGSLFTVTMPWHQKEAAPKKVEEPTERNTTPLVAAITSASNAPFDSKDIRLLIVDDNELNLITFSDFLNAKGYQVHNARDGAEAVHLATSVAPDLILMDIQMPGMDGLEATRRIRKIERLQGVPIIALTALAMPSDRELCLQAGASDYVSKPVSLKSLEKIVKTSLLNPDSADPIH